MRIRLAEWMHLFGALVLAYVLAGAPGPVGAGSLSQRGTPIQYGQTVTGTISDATVFQQYTFSGRAGDTVIITMETLSGNLDPLLLLGDADLNLIAEDDDGGGGFNARLEIVLPADGVYVIQATRYGQGTNLGQSSGDYRLTLSSGQQTGGSGGLRRGGLLSALDFGDTERGTLDADSLFHLFWFQARAGDQVTLRGTLGVNMAASLCLYDAAFVESRCAPDGRLLNTGIPADGVYFATLALSDLSTGGAYALTLSGSTEAGTSDGGMPVPLTYGQQVEGTVTDEHSGAYYVFQAAANDQVVIHMAAQDGNLDSFLYLYGPNGEIVGQDDDSGGSLDAELAVVIPAEGNYTILATRFGRQHGSSAGSYLLSLTSPSHAGSPGILEQSAQSEDALPPNFVGLTHIAYGDTVAGTLTNENYFRTYIFRGRVDDRLIITLDRVSGNLDPMIVLLDSQVNTIAQNDDQSETNRNARLEYTLPADDYYAILATRYQGEQGSTVGDFILHLEATNASDGGSVAALLPATVLSSGVPAVGQIGDAMAAIYTFYASEGDFVELTLAASGPLEQEGMLILTDADLGEIAVNTEGNLRQAITRDGLYAVIVTRQGGPLDEARGSFQLALTGARGAAPLSVSQEAMGTPNALMYGAVIGGEIRNDRPQVEYTFEGQAGDRVTIRLNAVDATLDPLVILLAPDGQEIERDDDGGGNLNALIDSILLINGGTYTVIATRFEERQGASQGRFELRLEGVPVSQPGASGAGGSSGRAIALSPGQTVAGTVSNEAVATFYVFQAVAGTTVQITMVTTAGNLDPFLALLDAGQSLVASDDDSGGNRNARLVYTVPVDGLYYIVATRFELLEGTTAGDYLLTLSGG
jgi:hypothetical protein